MKSKGFFLLTILFTNTIITNRDIQQFTDILGLNLGNFFRTLEMDYIV